MGQETRIRADKLFDGETMLHDQVVEIVDGRIRTVRAWTGSSEVVDVYHPGSTLIPGLIDTHCHLMWDASSRPEDVVALEKTERTVLRGARHAFEQLQNGVTTVRDLGAPHGLSIPLARALEAGDVLGARLIPAGRAIAMTGGHGWSLCVEADGPDAVRAATRNEIKSGARAIKLIASGGVYGEFERPEEPQLTQLEVRAVVEEAHKAGCLVAAHAYAPPVINMLIDEGVDSIEHGSLLDEPTAMRMAEAGIALVPTMSVFDAIFQSCRDTPDSPVAKKAAEIREASFKAVRIADACGVRLAMGTDAGAPGNKHGAVAREASLMVEAGTSAMTALRAATSEAAKVIGWEGQNGIIREGALADLVVIDGDPTENIESLSSVELVVFAGRVLAKEPRQGEN